MASMLHHLQQPMFLLGQKELNAQLDCTTCKMADNSRMSCISINASCELEPVQWSLQCMSTPAADLKNC